MSAHAQDGEDWEDGAESAPSRRHGPKTAKTGTQGQWGTTTIFGGEETPTMVPSRSQRRSLGPAGAATARTQATTARRQQQVGAVDGSASRCRGLWGAD